MKNFRFTPKKTALLLLISVFVGVLLIGRQVLLVRAAEQSGSSPTSSSDSRMKRLVDNLTASNYGDPNGTVLSEDWGESWNRIGSAAQAPFNDAVANGLTNGGNTDFPQDKGGIHDADPLPSGSYHSDWIVCGSGNNYCDTGDSTMESTFQARMDTNTGLIWSKRISSSDNWFTANNCAQPGSGANPGACASNGDPGCKCVKLTTGKTGCEAQGDGGWRLPYQKELMQAYIDGSSQYLPDNAAYHWSGTTNTTNTQNAWYTNLSNGNTNNNTKTNTNSFRCVRLPAQAG